MKTNELMAQLMDRLGKVESLLKGEKQPDPAIPDLKVEPGIYVLTKDIANPSGDKRVTTAFDKIPVWPKGARLTVRKLNGSKKKAFSIEPHDPIVENRNNKLIHVEKGQIFNTMEGFSELMSALKKEPESVETVIEEAGFRDPLEVLNYLNASGKLTLSDLRGLKPKEASGVATQAEAPF